MGKKKRKQVTPAPQTPVVQVGKPSGGGSSDSSATGSRSSSAPDTPPTPDSHGTPTQQSTLDTTALVQVLAELNKASASRPTSGIPAPAFSGSREDYRKWAARMRAWLRSQGMPLPAEKLSAAEQQALADQLLLTAPAHDQDLLLQTVDDGWCMWEALRHKYTRVTVAHLEAMHRKLRGAMLLNPTGVDGYISRIRGLILEIEEAESEHWSERRQISAYMHGLGPRFDSVRDYAAEKEELTVEKLLRKLRAKGDALVAKDARERERSHPRGGQQPQARDRRGGRPSRSQEGALVAQTIMCYRCGDGGHMARECKFDTNVCYHCKHPGHVKRDCPTGKLHEACNVATEAAAVHSVATSRRTREATTDSEEMVFLATTVGHHNPHNQLISQQGAWLIDSGATRSMTPDRTQFTGELSPCSGKVAVAKQDERLDIVGEGTVVVSVEGENGEATTYEMRALYVPGLAHNLLATSDVVERGGSVILSDQPYIEVGGRVVRCERYGRQTLLMPMERACITQALLHRRLGHADKQRCTKLAQELGIAVTERQASPCEVCTEANMRRMPLPKESTTVVTEKLEYVSADMAGPLPRAIDGNTYIIVYVDHATDFVFDYYLKAKSEAVQSIDWFVRDAGGAPKSLRTDGAGELQQGAAAAKWAELRVMLDTTTRATPQQNGKAERKIAVITEHVRALLVDSCLPGAFWSFAAHAAAVSLNMFMTTALKREDTPYHRFIGRQPDLSRLRVFGCRAWVHDPRAKGIGKLKPRAQRAVFVGYRNGVKGWLFYMHATGRIVSSRDARFLEDVPGGQDLSDLAHPDDLRDADYVPEEMQAATERQGVPANGQDAARGVQDSAVGVQHEATEESGSDEGQSGDISTALRRSRRTSQAPGAWWEGAQAVWEIPDRDSMQPPTSFGAAMNTEERESWLMAIQEELENHQSLQTFKYVPARPHMRLLTGGWVFSIKTDQTGQHTRFKARLFVRGCAQPGGTYGVTSSPVAPVLMMRLMVAQAAKDGWNLAHVDFKAAYLNAPVRETIYMQPVAGMNAPPGSVCQLLKAWPGLKQAGVCWWRVLKDWMVKHEFRQAQAEHCLFVRPDVRATTYVDEMLLALRTEQAGETLKAQLSESFRVTATPLMQYLNISIVMKGGRVYASQRKYVERLLADTGMDTANGCQTPVATTRLEDIDDVDSTQPCEKKEYRILVGRLLWLSGCTRPDITYAVNQLTKYYQSPEVKHMRAAKRVLRYLSRTRTLGIEMSRGGRLSCVRGC